MLVLEELFEEGDAVRRFAVRIQRGLELVGGVFAERLGESRHDRGSGFGAHRATHPGVDFGLLRAVVKELLRQSHGAGLK